MATIAINSVKTVLPKENILVIKNVVEFSFVVIVAPCHVLKIAPHAIKRNVKQIVFIRNALGRAKKPAFCALSLARTGVSIKFVRNYVQSHAIVFPAKNYA